MQRRHLALVAMGIGTVVLLSRWGDVSDWTEALVRQERVRPRKVVCWTSSGWPQVDLKRAREFMQKHADTAVVMLPQWIGANTRGLMSPLAPGCRRRPA